MTRTRLPLHAFLLGVSTLSAPLFADPISFAVDPHDSHLNGVPLTGTVLADFDPTIGRIEFSGGSEIRPTAGLLSGTMSPEHVTGFQFEADL